MKPSKEAFLDTEEGAMNEWQPIETAPKDGTYVLAWFTMAGGQIVVARWDTDQYKKKQRPYWRANSIYGTTQERGGQPTHWMPLPPPPEER